MSAEVCASCLPEAAYRERMIAITSARREATRGARITVLSQYMADELAQAGLRGARVLPPWVEVGPARDDPGEGFLLAGRLVAHKGADLGWQAWAQSGVGSPLRVAGAGRLAEGLLVALTASDALSTWRIYGALFVLALARTFSGPSATALLPQIVPIDEYPRATSWSSSAFTAAFMTGPALGGGLYALADGRGANGALVVYGVAAAFFLGALISTLWLPARRAEHRGDPGV